MSKTTIEQRTMVELFFEEQLGLLLNQFREAAVGLTPSERETLSESMETLLEIATAAAAKKEYLFTEGIRCLNGHGLVMLSKVIGIGVAGCMLQLKKMGNAETPQER